MAAPRIIEDHVRCEKCRYDLHGLDRDGRCPECGLPIFITFEAREIAALPEIRMRTVHHATLCLIGLGVAINFCLLFCWSPFSPLDVVEYAKAAWLTAAALLFILSVSLELWSFGRYGRRRPREARIFPILIFIYAGLTAFFAWVNHWLWEVASASV